MSSPPSYDAIIVGAGISGINAAYRLQSASLTYTILEARSSLGGTWDLFRYPGIRCDSDIFSFGFTWSPWTKEEVMPTGKQIKEYVTRSAQEQGIDQHMRFKHAVTKANWNGETKMWEVHATVKGEEGTLLFTSRFLFLGTGYYDYETPLQTSIPGIDKFEGKVIHPQFWPKDYDYTDKEVVVIGSGATAVTVLPAMTDKAKRVTMLQRSPTYIMARRNKSPLQNALFAFLPTMFAHFLNRMFYILTSILTTWFCRTFPGAAKALVRSLTVSQLPPSIKHDPHFKPRYNPWEQRFCASLDGDFFQALRGGKADVVTDTIKQVTEKSIELESGASLHPDVIVTATGLKLKFGGGVNMSVDGEPVNLSDMFAWKSAMIQDVPNLLFLTGYETASWTLGADVNMHMFLHLLREMKKRNAQVAVPRVSKPMKEVSMMKLKSTYFKVGGHVFPKGGQGQWEPKADYLTDLAGAKWGDVVTDMEFS